MFWKLIILLLRSDGGNEPAGRALRHLHSNVNFKIQIRKLSPELDVKLKTFDVQK